LWGLDTLFRQLAPGLEAAGVLPRDLAKEILQHQLISDSLFSRAENMRLVGPIVKFLNRKPVTGWIIDRWRYASAIRPEELVRILQIKIAGLPVGDRLRAELTGLLEASNEEALRKLTMLNDALTRIAPVPLGAVPAPVPVAGLAAAAPAVAHSPNYAVQVDRVFQQVIDSAGRSVGKLETWFSSSMDRVSQRFVVQVRMWTVVFAFLLAFGAHLDSLRLLDQLWTNPEMRAALANMRDGMLGEAKAILPPAGGGAASLEVPISPGILQEALERFKTSHQALANNANIPAGTTTLQDAVAWLTGQAGMTAEAGAEYRKIMIGVLHDHADKINEDLLRAGAQIIPNPYPGLLKYGGARNLLGVLVAAVFLSLGAPFWYNALKNLSNLRTVVASKEQQESSAA
jgi:hypothetical protein